MRLLWRLFAGAIIMVALLGALAAIAGLAGFVWPALDLFNHVQLVLLPLILTGLIFGLASLRRQPVRGIVVSLLSTGLLASLTVIAPEIVAATSTRPAAPPDRPILRLMSFNIYANNHNLDLVTEPVIAADPDILLVQEYWTDFRARLDPQLAEMFPYSIRCQGDRRAFIALFSRLPFSIAPGHSCVDDIATGARVARISVRMLDPDGRPFTVLTTHLDWPYPPERQVLQLAELSQAVGAVDGAVILGADFNSTPFSLALRNFVRQSGLARQTWLLPTWPADFLGRSLFNPPLFLPLDHVMTRDGITVHKVALGVSPGGSDHYPVVVDFSVD